MATRAKNINSELLAWAREASGLSLEEASAALGLKDAAGQSASKKLAALENGESFPTRAQLLKMAALYHRPLTTFYMPRPPIVAAQGEDFRQLPSPIAARDKGFLDALLRDVRARQDMVRSIIEEEDEISPLSFVNSMLITESVSDSAASIRKFLEIDQNFIRSVNNPEGMFGEFRKKIENKGVFVLLMGNLGSHHANIGVNVFRGFAIADKLAPFIVINDQDAKTARSFTLLHELVHIFVGATGISGSPQSVVSSSIINRTEKFCNDVASEILISSEVIDRFGKFENRVEAEPVIKYLADTYHVSEHMVAYRFLRTEKITLSVYNELASFYTARWMAQRERERSENQKTDGGPSYYVVRRHRLGNALLELVGRTIQSNELTHTKAAKLLGIKVSSVKPLLSRVKSVSGTHTSRGGV